MEKEIQYGITLITFLIILTVGLFISISSDEYIEKQRKNILLIILILVSSLIVQNCLEFWLIYFYPAPFFRTIIAIYGYTVRPAIIVLYIYIICPNKKHLIEWILVGLNGAIHLTALFSSICFTISKENSYVGGVLSYTCHIISAILLGYLLYLTYIDFFKTKKKESLLPIFLIGIIIATTIFDILYNKKEQMIDYLTLGIALVPIFYYIWLHLKFVRSHEKDLIAEQRIQLMLSQIQPHFIYNSLSSISELCETNPKEAQRITDNFADYLRFNFSALTSEKLISFEKQLSQVGFYLNIEKVRFPNKLNIVYDIKCKDFELPNLTIQPLVENAVKHGICKKDYGGTVWIRSYENDSNYVIEIEDDGVGFNVNEEINDGKSHVGIQNVRARLISYNNKISIVSEINKGTKITILVPKIH